MGKQIDSAGYKNCARDILAYIDEVCRKNNIKYYLMFGTLLGAVRHKGFIPWDDDIDVAMDRKNFLQLIDAVREDNHPYYKLMWLTEKADYDLPLPKMIDTRTELIQAGRKSELMLGIWVDVFILDDVPDDLRKQKKTLNTFAFAEEIWNYSQYRFYSLRKKPNWRAKAKWIIYSCLALPGSRFWANIMYRAANKHNGKSAQHFAPLVFCGIKRIAYKKEWFGNGAELEFEGRNYMVPQNWDALLTSIYGDYMTPPPEDKRNSRHGFTVYYKEAEQ